MSLTFMRLDPEAHRLISRWVGRRFLKWSHNPEFLSSFQ